MLSESLIIYCPLSKHTYSDPGGVLIGGVGCEEPLDGKDKLNLFILLILRFCIKSDRNVFKIGCNFDGCDNLRFPAISNGVDSFSGGIIS